MEIKELLKRPDSFGYHGDNKEMFITWSVGPIIETRDSSLLEKSNAEALQKILEDRPEWEDQWAIERFGHYGPGWVKHLTFKVTEDGKNKTDICNFLEETFRKLKDDYPVLDEDDFSKREYETAMKQIEEAVSRYIIDDVPKKLQETLCSVIYNDNNIEVNDDGSVLDLEKIVKDDLRDFNWLEEEESGIGGYLPEKYNTYSLDHGPTFQDDERIMEGKIGYVGKLVLENETVFIYEKGKENVPS